MSTWMDRYAGLPLGVFSPLAEILIFSFLVYMLITFFMYETRGAGVLRGLAMLGGAIFLVLFVAAKYLHLDNVSWIIENLVNISLIGVIVIFQPEIRHALVKLGETVRLWNTREIVLDKEIADAAMWIAKKGGVGGLIVVERDMQINTYIESGILLDAVCNAPLLRTIFTKNTPLHDGAAIIRQGRIIAANCLLPLSENIEMTRGMGTRHRAALGLAEESDALTVVISEETGQISVTMNGEFIRDLDYERLRSLLRKSVSQSANQSEEDEEPAGATL
ncbi:MAG: diadenylate cyclase [Planctomycetes bacterium]|nr:diadenylate cyclase [Planctomycetota bacterium]MCC8116944.1 diadenylate cyclase [Planctomycetota bacterium]